MPPKKPNVKEGNFWILIDTDCNEITDTFYCDNEQDAIEKVNDTLNGCELKDLNDFELIRGTKFKLDIGAIKLVKEK